ncbi:carboxypeptidase-like regulatory domain-containing protein [Spongiimicrobium sp. 3-5]|uniref:carboxypeptidase-like regulatory domain-containing protein n=1 Tax=Spongiimicrobium sp. 3-5 TaxID=3332596 RepID=UPI003980A3E7
MQLKNTIVFVIMCLTFTANIRAQQTTTITGRVTDGQEPLQGVGILIQGTSIGTETDHMGKYTISAHPGDVLEYRHVGMRSVEIVVEDVTRMLNITMYPQLQELDEVVVQRRKRRTPDELRKDYNTNKKIIKTSFGILDSERAGYAIRVVDGAELNGAAVDLLTAIQNKFSGLQIRTWTNPQTGIAERTIFTARTVSFRNARPALFEVDGSIFTSAPTFLTLDNIDRIAVISGLAGTNRYGSLGAGGVVIINTNLGNVVREPGTDKPYDQAKLRNNTFRDGDAQTFSQSGAPNYMVTLKNAKSEKEALAVYEKQQPLRSDDPYYLLETSKYFLKTWGNKRKSHAIDSLIKTKFAKNAVILKALAYKQEESGNLKEAISIYKNVLKLRPRYPQSYRDLGNILVAHGNYAKALTLYNRYINYRQLDTVLTLEVGIDSIIKTEFDNLINTKSEALGIKKVAKSNTAKNLGTRLVFEWNNSETEFALQFVNPTNNYFNWNHMLEENRELIMKEKKQGYSSAQFWIDGNLKGKWMVNLNYLGNKSYDPSYLKVTVYHNYGTSNQTQKKYFFRLSLTHTNLKLFEIVNNSAVVSN